MIVCFSGKKGSGKDTAADVWVKYFNESVMGSFYKVSLADPLKRFCQLVFGFTSETLWGPSELRDVPDTRYPRPDGYGYLSPRYALQTLGTEWGRNCYSDVWIDYAKGIHDQLTSCSNLLRTYTPERGVFSQYPSENMPFCAGVVIPDVRFPNEVRRLKEHKAYIVRVVRPDLESKDDHASETSLDSFSAGDFDEVVYNDSDLDTFRDRIEFLAQGYFLENS